VLFANIGFIDLLSLLL